MATDPQPHGDRSVRIEEHGRSGAVTYSDPGGSLLFHWEFGGSDVLAVIQVADRNAWNAPSAWFAGSKAEILRYVAAELIRLRAPGATAQVDEPAGIITLRQGPSAEHERREAVAWVGRYARLRGKLGLAVLVGGCLLAAGFWVKNKFLVVNASSGTPYGSSVRTADHIATLILTQEAYTPSLHHDPAKDRYRMAIFLVPLDPDASPLLIPIVRELPYSKLNLSRILGSDGHTLWFIANDIMGVDLHTKELVTVEALRKANPTLDAMWFDDTRGMEVDGRLRISAHDGSGVLEVDPATLHAARATSKRDPNRSPFETEPGAYLCAGFFTASNAWLGLHSAAEVEKTYKPGSWIRRVERAEEAKQMRRFCRGVLDPDSSGRSHRILSMTALDSAVYLNAAFLRATEDGEPLRSTRPASALMIFTSAPGLAGTLVIARVDTAAHLVWKTDTGLDRFSLARILPGERSMAFTGTRPVVPGKVSEPLVVIVENTTGAMRQHSLWQ